MRVARITIAVAALATAYSLIAAAAPAHAHDHNSPDPKTTVLTTAVAAPFNLDVRHGRILVADGIRNQVLSLKADGSLMPVVDPAPGTTGVATSKNGRYLAHTTTTGGPPAGIIASGLTITGPGGHRVEADTLAYERAHNPDAGVHYGVTDPSGCVRDALTAAGFRVDYTGAIDSHAYSVAAFGKGWVIADAGANALLRVSNTGVVSTLAVLPAQPATITAEAADALQLPACVAGVSYAFESVPTDVEVGGDGFLYVTTLPGGPENAVLGARGKVYRVNPWNGSVTQVASGLLGATNLAISHGKLYVTEFFAGRISLVKHGAVREYLALPGALSIEAGPHGSLYVGTGLAGPSSVVRVETTSGGWRHTP